MWIMIVLSSYFPSGSNTNPNNSERLAPQMLAVELSSRERCIQAAQFTKQQPKIYHAFCIKK
ncbi:hypothetical protein FDH01_gp158 [Acinetobacter phage vB_AbaM_ME3]|uniref:Uncharacterized protein n=1 Tax=Acinetobacter phage vB_AbaM_ME3 TaxID=1837876 RepID=A0A172Q0S9_9CAUD|nr:hypothetical protein FDH01_gp158 [Acinetobacter phage vB_AbaM_ME3]AND75464.1 hypothetical protein ME3_303 [Acinetobacter phage vB_AbaM_ME3]